MILTRHKFKLWVEKISTSWSDDDSPVWSIETEEVKPKWFVAVKPIRWAYKDKASYWAWCNEHLRGKLLCYYSDSDNQQEWWGFTDKNDIALWLLKWAR